MGQSNLELFNLGKQQNIGNIGDIEEQQNSSGLASSRVIKLLQWTGNLLSNASETRTGLILLGIS